MEEPGLGAGWNGSKREAFTTAWMWYLYVYEGILRRITKKNLKNEANARKPKFLQKYFAMSLQAERAVGKVAVLCSHRQPPNKRNMTTGLINRAGFKFNDFLERGWNDRCCERCFVCVCDHQKASRVTLELELTFSRLRIFCKCNHPSETDLAVMIQLKSNTTQRFSCQAHVPRQKLIQKLINWFIVLEAFKFKIPKLVDLDSHWENVALSNILKLLTWNLR